MYMDFRVSKLNVAYGKCYPTMVNLVKDTRRQTRALASRKNLKPPVDIAIVDVVHSPS